MESFQLFECPERIKLSEYPKLINPNLTIDEIQKFIKDKTGIKEENQRFEFCKKKNIIGKTNLIIILIFMNKVETTIFGNFLNWMYMINQDIILD